MKVILAQILMYLDFIFHVVIFLGKIFVAFHFFHYEPQTEFSHKEFSH